MAGAFHCKKICGGAGGFLEYGNRRDGAGAEVASIAAACFSIYAYQELKTQLESCDEFRYIFTSPTFVAEKTPKERREFYIPRLKREKSL